MREDIIIRCEEEKDFEEIRELILCSFSEGTSYSDGTSEVALVEEIRHSPYYLPELSYVAVKDGKIVGHFLFSEFPISPGKEDGYDKAAKREMLILAPVSVHADYLHQHIGSTMLKMGIEKVKETAYKGILVEGDFHFYNKVGFQTSSRYNIFPTSGFPLEEPRCMMCQETYAGAMKDISGFVVYDMYENA